ncbi:MAG: sulfite exporter TauE/SafE family protein [Flavobacteriales bacterium]|nr:sulfite exporter TauE/SafE family protein [Bacteroidota bacterium]MCB9240450.1 sulfite exporter TauE/SafE family protein [Flavobacteriales bacterium]
MDTLIWAALIMGIGGSLHCASMCGPLIFSVQFGGESSRSVWQMLAYHLGRTVAYVFLGFLFSLFIIPAELFRFQQYVSILAGVLVLLVVFKDKIPGVRNVFTRISTGLSSAMQRSGRFKSALPFMGFLNGLLPCGLSYAAAAVSVSYHTLDKISLFMLIFGLGTALAFMVFAAIGPRIVQRLRIPINRYMRTALIVTALLMVVRGSGLGIPYLSPAMDHQSSEVECCHKP